ncbi:MAG: hypothetical protein ABS40_17745 [Agrobacterium sp. SCN 61-19]|nr:MAG: hypothetical protein ABS40_17745 [Agrobacterium sp. SCN 61-19]
MLKRLTVLLAMVSLPMMASNGLAHDMIVAQVTTADPGYLFPNDKSQRNRQNSKKPSPPKLQQKRTTTLDAAAQARVRRAVQALAPEYHRRAKRDGEQRANAWIRQKAFELGQQEARRAKQKP